MKKQIDSLTGLRIFAALSIFLWHSQSYFFKINAFAPFYLAGAVPLFFVLSGFVLTISGMRGRSWGDFFVARIARIWPAHFASFILLFVAFWPWTKYWFHSIDSLRDMFFNLTLTQAWIPKKSILESFNGVSWSISAEMFFYAIFPLILRLMRSHPLETIISTLLLTSASMMLVNWISPNIDAGLFGAMSPISGLSAFALGVFSGTQFERHKTSGEHSFARWTIIEAGTLITVALINGIMVNIPPIIDQPILSTFLRTMMGPAFSYALLIVVFALSRGAFSRITSNRILVYLGEVSFSFYLVHQVVIRWYSYKKTLFGNISNSFGFIITLAMSLFIAIGMFHLIEGPARRRIIAAWNLRKRTSQAKFS